MNKGVDFSLECHDLMVANKKVFVHEHAVAKKLRNINVRYAALRVTCFERM
jgi:hypothetical protein